MKRVYVTFGGAAYDETLVRIVEDAPKYGADQVLIYDDKFVMDHQFYRLNRDWWTKRDTKWNLDNRGFGWFIWKPFVILHALQRLKPGDMLLYTDADTYPIADLAPVFEGCVEDNGMYVFAETGCLHRNFCKRDTLVVMALDSPQWGVRMQWHATARFLVFQAGRWRNEQFLMEWLTYCLNPLANTFDQSRIVPEYPDLHEPRCEQAILTNLIYKYQQPLHRVPDRQPIEATEENRLLYWQHPGIFDKFPQMFVHEDRRGDCNQLQGSKFRNVLP